MADLSITAASVVPGSNAVLKRGIAASAITAGQVVYRLAAGTIGLADADASILTAAAIGIAVNSCATGQPITYAVDDDDLTIGGAVVAGAAYYASSAAGGLAPAADVANPEYVTFICFAKSASKVVLKPFASGVQAPA